MGKSAKAPKTAKLGDLNALADKSYGQNKQMASDTVMANRANQTNPFGNLTWDKDPTTGQWTQTQGYNQQEQGLYDTSVANRGAAGQKYAGLMGKYDFDPTYGGAPAMPTVGGYNQQAIDTVRALQRPQLERARAAKEAQLAAMGLGTGSGAAWNTEQENIGNNENQADLQAILAGINQGNTEFGQGMQARQQGVSEQQQAFDTLGQALASLSGQAAPAQLQFDDNYAQQSPVASPDYVQNEMLRQQIKQNQYNAEAAAKSKGGIGGVLGSLGGTVLGSMAGPVGSAIGSKIGAGLFS